MSSDEITEAPGPEWDHNQIATMRIRIDEGEARLAEARENVRGAQREIEKMELILSRWRRYEKYQQQRVTILERRIRSDREQLRMEEDYASGVSP